MMAQGDRQIITNYKVCRHCPHFETHVGHHHCVPEARHYCNATLMKDIIGRHLKTEWVYARILPRACKYETEQLLHPRTFMFVEDEKGLYDVEQNGKPAKLPIKCPEA